MSSHRFFAGALLLILIGFSAVLAGCREESINPTIIVPTIEEQPPVAIDVPITSLLRNPYAFEEETIRIAGQYRSLPLMACGNDPHFSPATWTLSDGEYAVPASGFDKVLRGLGVPEIPLVVEGRWQYWEGPVGCGRRAPTSAPRPTS